jgi:hypothetical protein
MRKLRSKGLLANPFAVVMVLVTMLFITAVTYAFYGERGVANQFNTNKLASPHSVAYQQMANQRALLETDADSDSDGVPDWVSLLSRTATPGTEATKGAFTEYANDDTLTGKVARELFGSYMQTFAKSGISFAGINPERMAQDALRKSASGSVQVPNFSSRELSTTPADSTSFARYLEQMEPILTGLAFGPNELEIMQSLTTATTKATQELTDAVTYYDTYIRAMRVVTVPDDRELVRRHAEVIDAAQKFLYALGMLADMQNDPARAALGIELYITQDGRLRLVLEQYVNHLIDIKQIIG